MRALRYDGRADRLVKLAAWITAAVARTEGGRGEVVLVACSRCSGEARIAIVAGGKRDAERLLGTFARWHARCGERGERVEGAVEGRDPRPASYFEQFRRRRGGT